jgi:O-acetyl-ADP-ribose deacetylase (regulator of RNase III)
MIEFRQGDIFASGCESLVSPVNCVGKMGKGLALEFRRRFPKMFLDYKRACDSGRLKPGLMHVWSDDKVQVINFPTKDHYRDPSRLSYITSGLDDLIRVVEERNIRSLALPALGCGLGGLNWYHVRDEIVRCHDNHWKSLRVLVYEPTKQR